MCGSNLHTILCSKKVGILKWLQVKDVDEDVIRKLMFAFLKRLGSVLEAPPGLSDLLGTHLPFFFHLAAMAKYPHLRQCASAKWGRPCQSFSAPLPLSEFFVFSILFSRSPLAHGALFILPPLPPSNLSLITWDPVPPNPASRCHGNHI